ncbi:hypothetical protein LTR28_013833 [Elasticomyces elasticus]|nr:hypothetical protein LTR28_013833 [Elasticomyces elasticus]
MSSSTFASSPPPHGLSVPPILSSSPAAMRNTAYADPNARAESMTHRGRFGYASSTVSNVDSPRRIRRRKDPTPFNILIVGAKNSGKTSFIEFLRTTLALPAQKQSASSPQHTPDRRNSSFTSYYLETEVESERVGLTLWDSQGLEKKFVDLQLREMTSFIESKFEDTFTEEQKVVRSPGAKDTHIHCVFLILDPVRLDATVAASQRPPADGVQSLTSPMNVLGLDEDLDLQVLRALRGKTAVIPIISKADTLTTAHMAYLKRCVWDSLKAAELDPLEALCLDDDDDEDGVTSDSYDDGGDSDLPSPSDNGRDATGPRENDDSDNVDRSSDSSDASIHTASSQTTPSPPRVLDNKPTTRQPHARSPSSTAAYLSPPELSQHPPDTPPIPFSILTPDPHTLTLHLPPSTTTTSTPGPGPGTRAYPWGSADPLNAAHCDFPRLRDAVFADWRAS